jgi:hypothetical protein
MDEFLSNHDDESRKTSQIRPYGPMGRTAAIDTKPPREPEDDDDDDEEEDDLEESREPAVIREPDEDE